MEKVMQILQGGWAADALAVAIRLDLPARLANGPKHSNDLAKELGADPDHLFRLMRLMSALGFFTNNNGVFELTEAGRGADAFKSLILCLTDESTRGGWTKLEDSVKSGKTGHYHAFGQEVWSWYNDHPENLKHFNATMGFMTKRMWPMINAVDLSAYPKIIDIGGGVGKLGYAIAKRHTTVSVTVFDVPKTAEETKQLIETEYKDVTPRMTAVGGDFFKEVPTGGDLYTIKNVLIDWSNEDVIRILKNVNKAMGDHSRLLILEPVISADTYAQSALTAISLDVHMMVITGGRVRAIDDWKKLLDDSGFAFDSFNVVETQPMVWAKKK